MSEQQPPRLPAEDEILEGLRKEAYATFAKKVREGRWAEAHPRQKGKRPSKQQNKAEKAYSGATDQRYQLSPIQRWGPDQPLVPERGPVPNQQDKPKRSVQKKKPNRTA